MTKRVIGMLLAVALAGSAMAGAHAAKPAGGREIDTDRPGSDYASFDLAKPDPGRCEAACRDDAACRAWTFVRPGIQGDRARCWLKSEVPPAVADGCCISGVAAAPVSKPQAACEAAGGTWGPGGLMQQEMCFHPTPDAGQACRRAGDCTGHCLTAAPDATQGQCSAVEPIFGCYGFLDADGTNLEICVD